MNNILQKIVITNPVINPKEGNIKLESYSNIAPLIARLWRTVAISGGLLLLIYIMWGALDWITAGGDKEKVQTAKARIMNGIIGVAIVAASFAFVYFLESVFGFSLLKIDWPTPDKFLNNVE